MSNIIIDGNKINMYSEKILNEKIAQAKLDALDELEKLGIIYVSNPNYQYFKKKYEEKLKAKPPDQLKGD